MLPLNKCDGDLGLRVERMLFDAGVETPMNLSPVAHSEVMKKTIIMDCMTQIMEALGLDLRDDSLRGTPVRIADMFIDELFYGLNYANFPKCTTIENKMRCKDEFVIESGIQVDSVCEHHFVTIDGQATVAYIPNKKVLGLSKMNRLVDFFARRPQVQERLTIQIALALSFIAETEDVAVCINAVHYCVKARGVKDVQARTSTFHGTGRFTDINDPVRREFMERSRG